VLRLHELRHSNLDSAPRVSIVSGGYSPVIVTMRGRAIAARRKLRGHDIVAGALASTSHTVLAQIVPARFRNLSIGYCNEEG
jgi:hypothetical protein